MTDEIGRVHALEVMMRNGGCSESQIGRFSSHVEKFLKGKASFHRETFIQPVESLPKLSDLLPEPELLRQVAIVKLNGGLDSSMGLTGPKGLLKVKNGLDFYAVLVNQLKNFKKPSRFQPPLLFMNSIHTQDETEQRLKELRFWQKLASGFLQSRIPKIRIDGSLPDCVEEHAWCAPGHGDIYASLLDSGLRDQLLKSGIRFIFVSNIDNLGATLDSRPLRYMLENDLEFLLEVTRRKVGDQKGGFLAKDHQGKLLLRDLEPCPPANLDSFQDVNKYRFFNTNNLWLDLQALDREWTELPLTAKKKPVIPQEPDSEEIVELHQAMGAAIENVAKSGAIEVGRDRFIRVKTTSDLFLVRSDLYELTAEGNLVLQRPALPKLDLDPKHYKAFKDFDALVSDAPSLLHCKSLRVLGPRVFCSQMEFSGHFLCLEGGASSSAELKTRGLEVVQISELLKPLESRFPHCEFSFRNWHNFRTLGDAGLLTKLFELLLPSTQSLRILWGMTNMIVDLEDGSIVGDEGQILDILRLHGASLSQSEDKISIRLKTFWSGGSILGGGKQ